MFSYRAGHGAAGHTSALTSDRNSDRYRLQRLGGLCCILNMSLKIQDHLDKLAKLAEETNEIAAALRPSRLGMVFSMFGFLSWGG